MRDIFIRLLSRRNKIKAPKKVVNTLPVPSIPAVERLLQPKKEIPLPKEEEIFPNTSFLKEKKSQIEVIDLTSLSDFPE